MNSEYMHAYFAKHSGINDDISLSVLVKSNKSRTIYGLIWDKYERYNNKYK